MSIGNLYRWMPNAALLPLAPMRFVQSRESFTHIHDLIRDTFIKIHPGIDTKDKTVSQLKNLCLEAVNSGLNPDQQSLTFQSQATPSPPQSD